MGSSKPVHPLYVEHVTGDGVDAARGVMVSPFVLRLDQLLQRLLITVPVGTRVEMAGPLPDDRTRDCHHLGIELALGAAELWCPNIACSAQCEQRHSVTARLYHDHALAPAEGEAPEPDDSGLGHCRADHPECLDRDRAIR